MYPTTSTTRRPLSMLVLSALLLVAVLLTACGGTTAKTSAPPPNARTINVTLADFTIAASETTFTTGQTYHFVVANKGKTNHEFMAMPMTAMGGMNTGTMSMEQMDKMALFMIAASQLPPGATKTIDYTFQEPAGSGQLEFDCHVSGHYELGMHLPITVKG